jgi:serine phosphatase RsbU (regulator of sigma subunit)
MERKMIDPVATNALQEPSTTSFRIDDVRLSTWMMPAPGTQRGSDWCEAFAVTADIIAISIGDVCGLGEEKFDAMVAIRQGIRAAALCGLDPAQTLSRANLILRQYDAEERANAIFGLLDMRHRTMTYANAGHPPPLMVDPCGTLFLEYPGPDLPLGINRDLNATNHAVSAPAATLFVFYTHGLSESRRDAIHGAVQLRGAAKLAREVPELPAATTVAALMLTETASYDDAKVLSASTPHFPIIRAGPARRQLPRTHLTVVNAADAKLRHAR